MKIKIVYSNETKATITQKFHLSDIIDKFSFPGWEDFFISQVECIKFISDVLEEKCPLFLPLKMDVFRVFSCRPENIKVVIIGQDPYHNVIGGVPAATGLSFSCSSGINPSLRNIYKEIKEEYPDFVYPMDGDLVRWFNQEVFLMNTALTVEEGKPGMHLILWRPFTEALIEYIKTKCPDCIYLIWGASSRKMIPIIGNSGYILETSHPSSMSFEKGFHGCGHFKKCNEILLSIGKSPINW